MTDAAGNGRLIAEDARAATPPAAVGVTREPVGRADGPTGPVVTAWQRGTPDAR